MISKKNKFWLFSGFVLLSLIVYFFSGYLGLNLTSIETLISTNFLISIVLYTLLFIALTSFSFSVSVMTSSGVLLFASYIVILCSMIGIIGSSVIDFYISRKLGKDYVRNYLEKKGGKLEEFDKIVEKNPVKTIFILSTIFFVPPTIPNLLGGITNISLKKYIIATFFGNLPNTIFTVYLIQGILYSNTGQIYFSIIGLIITSLFAIIFYKKEIKSVLRLSFPFIFRY